MALLKVRRNSSKEEEFTSATFEVSAAGDLIIISQYLTTRGTKIAAFAKGEWKTIRMMD